MYPTDNVGQFCVIQGKKDIDTAYFRLNWLGGWRTVSKAFLVVPGGDTSVSF